MVNRRLFALDHNFPQPIAATLAKYMPEAELMPLQKVDARLPDFEDDWEILLALHHDARHFDGMITTDSSMISLPRELSVLMQTKLTLIVAEATGHDPLKATGLVLSHLPGICRRVDSQKPQLWRLATRDQAATDPWETLTKVAERRGTSAQKLFAHEKLAERELARDPLA